MAKDINKQMVAPAVAAPKAAERLREDEARDYLLQAGWEEQARNEVTGESFWADPAGMGDRRGKRQNTGTLPGKDGTDPIVVSQHVCPPAPWNHTLRDAMVIQRDRDRAAKAKEEAEQREPALV